MSALIGGVTMGDKVGKIKDDLPGVARVGTPYAEEIKEELEKKFKYKFSNSYSRILNDTHGPGQWEWLAYANMSKDSKASEMRKERSELQTEVKEAQSEMEILLEEYREEPQIKGNWQFLTSTGAIGEYRRKKRHVRKLNQQITTLEQRIEHLNREGCWEETTRKNTYQVFPRKLEMSLQTDFSNEDSQKWSLTLMVYDQEDEKKTEKYVDTARTLAQTLQKEYPWMDIRLRFKDELTLYRKLKE